MLNLLLDFARAIAYNARMQVNINTVCKGDSLWSTCPGRRVRIDEIELSIFNDDYDPVVPENGDNWEGIDFGELIAAFNQEDWVTKKDGLIYTDRGWIRSFRLGLRKLGFSWKACMDVDYSEQGMQSSRYVSMDVGEHFIREYCQKVQIPVDDRTQVAA